MRESMIGYFQAEKQEAAIFVAVGAVALAVALLLLRGGGPWRAMAWPLGAIALIQLAVGGAVHLRTDGQVAALEARLATDPAAFRAEEAARMEKVMAGFRTYKAVEVALLAAGIALALLFPGRQALLAAGVGLIIQPAFMLVLDLFAEHRGRAYLAAIARLAAAP